MQEVLTAPAAPLARAGWLDPALYPFSPRTLATEHGALRYLDEGTGRPVLFVHGTPSWSFEWRHAIAALRTTHRCIAPDHLGFGLSDKPREAPYTPADHARRLDDLVTALDLHDLTLVVHDFGGPIGLPLALEHPERIASVVVLNSWMWPLGDDPRARRLSRLIASPLGRFLYRWLNASPRWLVPAMFADRGKLSREVHRHYVRPFATRAQRTGPWALGCALTGADPHYASLWDRRQILAELPLTLLWGADDPAFGDALARWQDTFPHAHTVALDGVGHFPQEEAPEAVVEALRASMGR